MRTSVLHSTKLLKLSRLLGLLNLQAPRRKVGCCSHASRDGKTELSRGQIRGIRPRGGRYGSTGHPRKGGGGRRDAQAQAGTDRGNAQPLSKVAVIRRDRLSGPEIESRRVQSDDAKTGHLLIARLGSYLGAVAIALVAWQVQRYTSGQHVLEPPITTLT